MNLLRKIWPSYLTLFVISLAMTVGFTIGMIVAQGMALTAISTLKQSTNAAILREFGE